MAPVRSNSDFAKRSHEAFVWLAIAAVFLGAWAFAVRSRPTGVVEFALFVGLALWVRQRSSLVGVAVGIVFLLLGLPFLFVTGRTDLVDIALRIIILIQLIRAFVAMWNSRGAVSVSQPSPALTLLSVAPTLSEETARVFFDLRNRGLWLALAILIASLLVFLVVSGGEVAPVTPPVFR